MYIQENFLAKRSRLYSSFINPNPPQGVRSKYILASLRPVMMSGRGPFSVVRGPVMGSNVARFRGCSWGGPVVVPGHNVGPWCNAGTGGRVTPGGVSLPSFLRSFFGPAVVAVLALWISCDIRHKKRAPGIGCPSLGLASCGAV